MNVVDITPIFCELIQNIILLDYDELVKTSSMQEISEYINDKNEFMVHFEMETKYFETIDDLFFGTMEYFKKQHKYKEMEWIDQAIKKMETFVMGENVTDMMELFNFNL